MERAMDEAAAGQPRAPEPWQLSLLRAGVSLVVIACGLSLRWFGFAVGLSAFVVKYGGSALWASMVFLLVGALLPRLARTQIAVIAIAIAVMVELTRLIHAPWLDAFRLTTAGALLLGRIFSLWNMAAYAVGVLFAAGLDRLVAGRLARNAHSAS